MKVNPNNGSSPHTRGAHVSIVGYVYHARIIPAYAGSTRLASLLRVKPRGSSPHTRGALSVEVRKDPDFGDHPRIRGEHSLLPGFFAEGFGSSPHTRGALRDAIVEAAKRGIIPAYAGSTAHPWNGPRARTDHPRIRGEHFVRI